MSKHCKHCSIWENQKTIQIKIMNHGKLCTIVLHRFQRPRNLSLILNTKSVKVYTDSSTTYKESINIPKSILEIVKPIFVSLSSFR